jgi:hypothetical protein
MSWIDKLTRHEKPMGHIRWDDLEKHAPPKAFAAFEQWMRGQTCLACDDGVCGVYLYDFDRWVAQGQNTEQGSDWD